MWKVLLLLQFIVLSFQDFEKDGKVLILNQRQFKSLVTKQKYLYVFITDSGCEKCEYYWNIFKEACDMVVTGSPGMPSVPCAKIDLSGQTDFAKEIGLQGFPTLRFYMNGTYSEYDRDWEKKEVERYIDDRTGLHVVEIDSDVFFYNFPQSANCSVLYLYPKPVKGEKDKSLPDDPWLNDFKMVARRFKKHYEIKHQTVFQHSFLEKEARDRLNIPNDVQLIVWNNRGEDVAYYRGEKDMELFTQFVIEQGRPYIQNFTDVAIDYIFYGDKQRRPVLFLITENEELEEPFFTQFKKMARKNKAKMNFIQAHYHVNNTNVIRLLDFLGIKDKSFPQVAIYDYLDSQKKYLIPIKLDIHKIEVFLEAFFTDALNPNFKSQEPPQNQPDSIIQLVGKTYLQQINQAKQPLLINFYAPWCNVSKNFSNVYENVYQQFKTHIDFAQIDGSQNEVEGHFIPHFPIVKLYNQMRKEYTEYTGELNEKELATFLNTQLKLNINYKAQDISKKHDDL